MSCQHGHNKYRFEKKKSPFKMKLSNAADLVVRREGMNHALSDGWREYERRNPREAALAAVEADANPYPGAVARLPPIPGVVPAATGVQHHESDKEELPLRQSSQEAGMGQRARGYTSDSDEEDEDSTLDGDRSFQGVPSECESLYTDAGNCKKLLLVMCLGLTGAEDRALGDPTDPPYCNAVQKTLFGNTSEMVKKEVKRRAEADGRTVKCNYWSKKKCIEHLIRTPITSPTDKVFLIATEKALYEQRKVIE